jgi:hypothetical protein
MPYSAFGNRKPGIHEFIPLGLLDLILVSCEYRKFRLENKKRSGIINNNPGFRNLMEIVAYIKYPF